MDVIFELLAENGDRWSPLLSYGKGNAYALKQTSFRGRTAAL